MNDAKQGSTERSGDDYIQQRDVMDRGLSIAVAQRGMMWLLIARVGLDFSFGIVHESATISLTIAYSVLYFLISAGAVVFLFRIVMALYGVGPAIICAGLSTIPCLGSIVVLIVDTAAMDWLRKIGVKVGVMGATSDQLRSFRQVVDRLQ